VMASHAAGWAWYRRVDRNGSSRPASMSELVRGSAVDALTEVTLGAAQVEPRVLPIRALTSVGRGRAQGVAGVCDGVVEAVGLDVRGGLLPSTASPRLVG
jgi:hypothetical protein